MIEAIRWSGRLTFAESTPNDWSPMATHGLEIQRIPQKDLFWASEAARILKISLATLYRRIEDGTIPTHLPIKPYKIRRTTLVNMLSHDSL